MPIWKYGDISRDLDLLWSTDDCPFCNLTLHKIFSRSKQGHTKQVEEVIDISICRTCGWPMAKKNYYRDRPFWTYGYCNSSFWIDWELKGVGPKRYYYPYERGADIFNS